MDSLIFLLSNQVSAAEPVVYAWAESMAKDTRGHYPIELLKLALAKSGKNFSAKPSKLDQPQWRTLRHLEMEKGMVVVWTFTAPERENSLLPIRIPIDRGLLGWRLLLIKQSDAQIFADMAQPDQLKTLRSGQGNDWPDYPILKHNGFKVTPSSSYEGLFHILTLGRMRYFPRSLTEIQPELEKRNQLDRELAVYREHLELLVNERTEDLQQKNRSFGNKIRRARTIKS